MSDPHRREFLAAAAAMATLATLSNSQPAMAGDPSFMNNVPDPLLSGNELPTFKFALEKSEGKVIGGSYGKEATVGFCGSVGFGFRFVSIGGAFGCLMPRTKRPTPIAMSSKQRAAVPAKTGWALVQTDIPPQVNPFAFWDFNSANNSPYRLKHGEQEARCSVTPDGPSVGLNARDRRAASGGQP